MPKPSKFLTSKIAKQLQLFIVRVATEIFIMQKH